MKKLLTIIAALTVIISALVLAPPAQALSSYSVTVDGTVYKAHKGDIIHYTCYLDMSSVQLGKGGLAGRISELEGRMYYDKSRLKLITDLTPDPDDGSFASMPNIKNGSFVLSNSNSSYMGYNAVNTYGYDFSKKKVLFKADFEVTAAKKSSITNVIECLGSGSVKLIEDQLILIETVLSYKVTVECPHTSPTEPATSAPTQKPTQKPTQPPTQAPTQPPTQAPTLGPGLRYDIGDVDMNGVLTIMDASCIQRSLCGLKELSYTQELLSDYDRDGLKSIMDVTAIQRSLAE